MNKTRFQIALIRRGLPACGLAQRIGIDRATMSRIVNGWTRPSIELRKKIATELGMKEKELFGHEEI